MLLEYVKCADAVQIGSVNGDRFAAVDNQGNRFFELEAVENKQGVMVGLVRITHLPTKNTVYIPLHNVRFMRVPKVVAVKSEPAVAVAS